MAILKKSCFSWELRTGCFIIGGLELVMAVIAISYELYNVLEPEGDEFTIKVLSRIVVSALTSISCGLLIYGAKAEKPSLTVMWQIMNVIRLLTCGLAASIMPHFAFTLYVMLNVGLAIYMGLVVFSFYKSRGPIVASPS